MIVTPKPRRFSRHSRPRRRPKPLRRTGNVFLELRFPGETPKSLYATEQLYTLLQGISADLSKNRQSGYSLEIVSDHDHGIRYLIVVPSDEAAFVRRSLLSYLPGMVISTVKDYVSLDRYPIVGVSEFRLQSLFAFPIRRHGALEEHDPIAFITGYMTGLSASECVALQLVVSPMPKSAERRLWQLKTQIELGEPLRPSSNQRVPLLVEFGFKLPLLALELAIGFIKALASTPTGRPGGQFANQPSPNAYTNEQLQAVQAKLDRPLFQVSLRLLVGSAALPMTVHRTNTLVSAFRMFTTANQAIVPQHVAPIGTIWRGRRRLARFCERRQDAHRFSYGMVLSADELADLYHFPNTERTKTDGLVYSRNPELPLPLSMKRQTEEADVVLGTNRYGNKEWPIGLTLDQRRRHTYIVGKTGTGKTTLLTSAIYQDIVQGKGVAVLDPHGDMFRELLGVIPEHRIKDVVVFDPADRQHPVGLNILDPGIAFDSVEERREWVTSAVVSTFAKLTNPIFWGPRMEHVLRNAALSAQYLPNPTLYSLQRLLTDRAYQRWAAARIDDEVLQQFWQKEVAKYSQQQFASLVAPLTHRLGQFITTTRSRNILLQKRSSLRLPDIMDNGKILLANLSKGDLGEDQSVFFGTLLTSLIWIAAYQRARLPEHQRRDFFLYVDEFQNFATPQFADITSEGRKFHVALTAAHQNISQVRDSSLLSTIAGNSHTLISFKANPEDEAFLLPFMEPALHRGDILNLPPHKFFMRTTTDDSEDAFSGITIPLAVTCSDKTRNRVLIHSRKQYALTRSQAEKQVQAQIGHGKRRVASRAAPKPVTLRKAEAWI